MMSFIKNLLKRQPAQTKSAPQHPVRPIAAKPRTEASQSNPAEGPVTSEDVTLETKVEGRIESQGPGKNVLVQNEYQQENTGIHEELSIVDESAEDSDNAGGIDPYNTGQFDRSKNWDKRFRK